MKEETAQQILDDISQVEEYNIHSKRNVLEAYTKEEIDKAIKMYPEIEGIELEILTDWSLGATMLAYRMRTGEEITKQGLMEELVVAHLISVSSGIDMLDYSDIDTVMEIL